MTRDDFDTPSTLHLPRLPEGVMVPEAPDAGHTLATMVDYVVKFVPDTYWDDVVITWNTATASNSLRGAAIRGAYDDPAYPLR